MKKFLFTLLALVCCFAVFAEKNSVNFKFTPMTVQIVTSSNELDDSPVISKFGLGAELSYERNIICNYYLEGCLGWNTYQLPDDRPYLTNLMAFGGVGYAYQANDELTLKGHIDIATDTLLYQKKGSETISLKLGLCGGLNFAENIDATISCDGVFGFCKKDGTNYVNYRILPSVGMTYSF